VKKELLLRAPLPSQLLLKMALMKVLLLNQPPKHPPSQLLNPWKMSANATAAVEMMLRLTLSLKSTLMTMEL
jgi:hypothetical protein